MSVGMAWEISMLRNELTVPMAESKMIIAVRSMAILVLATLSSVAVAATVLALSLPEMVKKADVVAVVTVGKVERTGAPPSSPVQGEEWAATANVVRALKGRPPTNIYVSHFPSSPAGFKLDSGSRYILFLERNGERYIAVQGYRGIAKIDDGSVTVSMLNEKSKQNEQAFIRRIEAIVKSTSDSK